MPPAEDALVDRAKSGDTDAFRQLVEAYSHAVFRVAARICGDAAMAEEVVQETFVKAWRELPRFEERARFGTWLYRIAVNTAFGELRRRLPWKRLLIDDMGGKALAGVPDTAPSAEQMADAALLRRALHHALQTLTPLERTAFALRHYEGRSIAEIAAALALSENAAKQAIFRAVRKLRAALAPAVKDDD